MSDTLLRAAEIWQQRAETAEARVREVETALQEATEAITELRQKFQCQPHEGLPYPYYDGVQDRISQALSTTPAPVRDAERAVVEAAMKCRTKRWIRRWTHELRNAGVEAHVDLARACDNLAKLQEHKEG